MILMSKEKKLLIVGCSHAAGFEILGTEDSAESRQLSFGNVLARKIGRKPINVAMGGLSNSAILRTMIDYVEKHHDEEKDDLFVLVAWSEPMRVDVPVTSEGHLYNGKYKSPDMRFISNCNFRQIVGPPDPNNLRDYERPYVDIVLERECEPFFDIMTLTQVIAAQGYLEKKNIKYIMCNSMTPPSITPFTASYFSAINKTRFMDLLYPEKSFYFYYRDLGYENTRATYWHHDAVPHELYAKKLEQWIVDNDLL